MSYIILKVYDYKLYITVQKHCTVAEKGFSYKTEMNNSEITIMYKLLCMNKNAL